MSYKCLHVGCGPVYLKSTKDIEWVNIDKNKVHKTDICIDCLELNSVFCHGTIDFLSSCHMIEHLSYPKETVSFLSIVYGLLKKGGVARFCVPDLEKIARMYLFAPNELKAMYGDGKFYYYKDLPAEYFQYFSREWEHKVLFDKELLASLLKDAGFGIIKNKKHRESDYPDIFNHDRLENESLYMEAVK